MIEAPSRGSFTTAARAKALAPSDPADEAFALEVAEVVEQVALGFMPSVRLEAYVAEQPALVARAARAAGVVFDRDAATTGDLHEAAMAASRARVVASRAGAEARARCRARTLKLERSRARVRPRARRGPRARRRSRRRRGRARASDDPGPSRRGLA